METNNNNNSFFSINLNKNKPMKLQFTQVKKAMGLFVIPAMMTIGSHIAEAQVKVGANPATITTGASLDVEGTSGSRTVILGSGNMGVNQVAPTNQLHVTSAANPARLEGLQTSTDAANKSVVVDGNGVLKVATAGVASAISVSVTANYPIQRGTNGSSKIMVNDAITVNSIVGASYDAGLAKTITVPPGTYIMTMTFEASINTSSVVAPLHSYFYDFPNQDGTFTRIHANSPSNPGGASSHGVCITYVARYTTSKQLQFNIGWGQGGNMASGDILNCGKGTQLSLIRIAD